MSLSYISDSGRQIHKHTRLPPQEVSVICTFKMRAHEKLTAVFASSEEIRVAK
jgi:hypothetical protein